MLMQDSGFHQVDIGTIFPGESVTLRVQMSMPLSVRDDAYLYQFPMVFFPKYVEAIRAIPGDNLSDP